MICPVCRGSKLRYNDDTRSWGPQSCIACGGSGMGPVGNQAADATLDKMKATRLERGIRPHGNGHVPWLPAEDDYITKVDAAWRQTATARRGGHRPQGWYERLADELHRLFPDQPLRSKNAVKQRIMRLNPTATEG
jgi:hypothetical protein